MKAHVLILMTAVQSGATLKAFSVNFNNTDSSAKCEA